ncbi:MAG: HDOD domain-containing protein [candidate division Zixibacteria bacterium]|nr:HDOD domain-containing protein [candidate division Zixibacteria bacterium]
MTTVKSILAKQINLPSPPIIIQKLQSHITEEDVNNKELAEIIETDASFTARILRLVNSPFYGFVGRIKSVEEAITMLGFNTVHQLLLTTSMLNTVKVENKIIDLNKFWLHSFSVGVMAKHLLCKADKDIQNEGFMGGILHDIGRMIFVKMDPDRFISFYTQEDKVIDLESEAEYFDINHQELGKILAEKWNFPESISSAIAYHHFPDEAPDYQLLASAVNIADMLCHALNIGDSFSYYITDFFPSAWDRLNIEMNELETVFKDAFKEIDKSKILMGMMN